MTLDGLVQPESRSLEAGIPHRDVAAAGSRRRNAVQRRNGKKRLTFAIGGDTYRCMRVHAVETDRTRKAILEAALGKSLNRAKV